MLNECDRVLNYGLNECGRSVRYADPELNDSQQGNLRDQDKHERARANTATRARTRCVRQSHL